ncbi:hypothetical protein HYZ70_01375 [Candidatus Curtissbacteria bacterium]|nr:hypothetical protein [Candidatus Curtissbacteria bacterium]
MPKSTLRIQRLARREERQVIRRIVFLSVISVILAAFVFTIGVSLLGKFADLLDVVFKSRDEEVSESAVPRPPILDDLPETTNSARLVVSGFATDGNSVEVYLGDEKLGEAEIVDSKFKYENVSLFEGENKISAKAVLGDKTSDSSKVSVVILDKDEPRLEIESPTEGQNFIGNNRIKVMGKTDLDATVYANGFLASLDFEGKFEVLVPVAEGESEIEIKAIDLAGNTKVEKRKIVFRK